MKIMQIIQKPQLRGAEIFACQLSAALEKKGVEVVVVTLFEGNVALPFNGRVVHLGLSLKKRLFNWSGIKKLARVIREERPDVIQANAGDTLKYAVMSRFFFGWKTPIVFRNASMVSLYLRNAGVRLFNAMLYQGVNSVISVSESTKKDIISLFPFLRRKTSVIPIGIVPAQTSEHHEEKKSQFILVHIGGFTFEKNHEGILRIFKAVKQTCPHVVLWLIGDGPLRKSIERKAQEMMLGDAVTFWGSQAEPLKFLKSADLFILPSIIEGLPGVVLEAFFCHLPVVAYEVGGVGEIVINNRTGALVVKNNEPEFIARVKWCVEHYEATQPWVHDAYETVVSTYLIDRVAEKFLMHYTTLCRP